jgi:ribose transport system substrate-binding protein
LIWKGPLREDDREQQVQVVEGFVTQQVSGIVLAPFDKNALVRPVEEAKRAGIPTVVIDSASSRRTRSASSPATTTAAASSPRTRWRGAGGKGRVPSSAIRKASPAPSSARRASSTG